MKNISSFSIIIIEYFCLHDIRKLIAHLEKTLLDYNKNIIIVSNSGYSIKEQKSLSHELPNVKWIFNKNNTGFAGGMNCGMSQTDKDDFFILMNPDTQIQKGELSNLDMLFKKHPKLGMIVPKFVDYENKTQDYCRNFLTLPSLFHRALYRIFTRRDVVLNPYFDYNCTQEIDWSAGAFMAVRQTALKDIGLMDENYFMYVEDMDWCRRFWTFGYKILYYPELVVQYKGDMKSTSFLNRKNIINKYTFHHIISLGRYFFKYGITRFQPRK